MNSPLFKSLPGGDIQCLACAHKCVIQQGKLGKCRVRGNQGGAAVCPTYGRYTVAVDPIEKKPLHHFLPGSNVYSYGTVGCNFSCQFCQNSSLSMWKLDLEDVACIRDSDIGRLRKLTPEKVVREAIANDCLSIASTYNEPTVSSEFSHDVFKLAKEKGLYTVYVTNGYESEECLNYLAPYLDAVNIDLKSFSDDFYMKICGAHLKPVCDTIRRCYAMGIHTEVTTLIIPGNNDSDKELTMAAEFIASVGKDIPWHLSAYHDAYNFSGLGRTPLETLQRAFKIGQKAGIQYIYLGNVSAPEARVTKCPECGNLLIDRVWFGASVKMHGGKCKCGHVIPGLFSDADNRKPKLNSIPEMLLSKPAEHKVGLPKNVILYATQGGTSKEVAEKLSAAIGYPAHDINSITIDQIESCDHVIFVVATYGRGAPPASATSFWSSIQENKKQLSNLKYAVIGLGSSSFAKTFCGFGKDLDAALQKFTASQMIEFTSLDEQEDDNSKVIEAWIEKFKSLAL